ncbi:MULTISPECIES: hypothetical protein [unclassified Lysinibacillus]|uniref:hypothetical protein n=1 Tax=unclassified Lysinibacillus TaxID=2636778 RepID=UPI0011697B21|nr:hypothetical protein [Lysinibacillus sp. CD3-6]QPQ36636.1 hypothetical protein JNUCC52_06865 [Lysinibacillus sp. JNUCC-52]UED81631.1 hypothetical protein FH508_0006980 [Lysinibacillus sp. CD3-6]
MNKNLLANIFLFMGIILLLLKLFIVMGYLKEVRGNYGTYMDVYLFFFFIGVVLKSSRKGKGSNA